MNDKIIFSVKNIRKTFRSRSCICYNIELNIRKKSFTFITGDSGIGKSTLLHMLGLLDTPERMSKDSVLTYQSNKIYDYFDIVKKEKSFLRCTEFGFLPQGGHLLQPLSIIENLTLVFNHRSQKKSDEKEITIRNIMGRVGLNVDELIENTIWNRRNISPINLSGGEKQRLALARTILCDPKVIFVDEPTTYMDKPTAKLCVQVLQNCISENDSTIILVTHDFDELHGYLKEESPDNEINIKRYHLVKTSEERNALNVSIDNEMSKKGH